METIVSIATGVITNLIYDSLKIIYYSFRKKEQRRKLENYISTRMHKKYEELYEKDIFFHIIQSPEIKDLFYRYLELNINFKINSFDFEKYHSVSQLESGILNKLVELTVNVLNRSVQKNTSDIVVREFYKYLLRLTIGYIRANDKKEELYLTHSLKFLYQNLEDKIDNLKDLLKNYKNIPSQIIGSDINIQYEDIRQKYNITLRKNNEKQQIYTVDNIAMEKFYVKPRITSSNFDNPRYENWYDVFSKSNFTYLIGGAGFGKSLFMKMLTIHYSELNIVDADKHLVIYAELKKMIKKDGTVKSVLEFLSESIRDNTLVDELEIDKEFIRYYLRRG